MAGTASMIPKECHRLAEVDFPIAVVSRHAMREKSIRHGHPSTLHLWWARRPLASCRAMLLALLLPDPCDEHCPEDFKDKARDLLPPAVGPVGPKDDDLRAKLLKFIGDFANWDLSADKTWLEAARGLVKAAHPEEPPLVVDPFAGGGSIPLEALRVGCEAFASDLNPVACLILKVMLEDIPRHGPGLADELRRVGADIKAAAENELAEFYPADPDGARPIAYLWARTVRCEAPNCGAEIPLARSFWLSKKANRKRALRYSVVGADSGPPRIEFEIFEPRADPEVPRGTVTRAKASCPSCGTVLPPDRVREQLRAQRGGADPVFDARGNREKGARLLAVAIQDPERRGRRFRPTNQRNYAAAMGAARRLASMAGDSFPSTTSLTPDEFLPPTNTLGLRVPNYGVRTWSDLFSPRQKLTLATLAKSIRRCVFDGRCNADLAELLAITLSRTADYGSANCSLHVGRDVVRNTWARNALPIVWDYYETNPFGEGSGNFTGALEWVEKVTDYVSRTPSTVAQVNLADATDCGLPDDSCQIWFTDPPYYDAIGYSESSDFFFAWMKRVLADRPLLQDPFDPENSLTPKKRECIQDDTFEAIGGIKKDREFFETTIAKAFSEGRRILDENGAGCIVFAHKTTEGWEALLGGITKAGWAITASWPIETEMKNKVSGAQAGEQKAMLLASVHLVCRPRPSDAGTGDWGDVLSELPHRVGEWMERLQAEGVRGADLVFACIGPALAIFSRYARVETAEGREVELPEYLEKVWEVVGRTALEQVLGTAEARARNGLAGALEEDARLTALFLWTLQSTNANVASNGNADSADEDEEPDDDEEAPTGKAKGYSLIFDVVRRFAQPLGIRLPDWEGRIIETQKGVVRLLSVKERVKQLFGESGTGAMADEIEASPLAAAQLTLFPEEIPTVRGRGRRRGRATIVTADALENSLEATTLDRVHAAMLLQASGRSQALRNLLKAEQERGPDFLRLANALSALYPRASEEKRLLDAMLLAVPR
jgi:adenine-specific DNA methylase